MSSDDIAALKRALDDILTSLRGDLGTRGILHEIDNQAAAIDEIRSAVEHLQNSHKSRPSPVVEIVRILASPSGVGVVFLMVIALVVVVNSSLGQSTDVRHIPAPSIQIASEVFDDDKPPAVGSSLSSGEIERLKAFAEGLGDFIGTGRDAGD